MIESEMPNLRNEYEHICDFRTHAINGSYSHADARLIAAAPDLLEACKSVLTWASIGGDHGGNPYCKDFVRLAQAAIEKAEGL